MITSFRGRSSKFNKGAKLTILGPSLPVPGVILPESVTVDALIPKVESSSAAVMLLSLINSVSFIGSYSSGSLKIICQNSVCVFFSISLTEPNGGDWEGSSGE